MFIDEKTKRKKKKKKTRLSRCSNFVDCSIYEIIFTYFFIKENIYVFWSGKMLGTVIGAVNIASQLFITGIIMYLTRISDNKSRVFTIRAYYLKNG